MVSLIFFYESTQTHDLVYVLRGRYDKLDCEMEPFREIMDWWNLVGVISTFSHTLVFRFPHSYLWCASIVTHSPYAL